MHSMTKLHQALIDKGFSLYEDKSGVCIYEIDNKILFPELTTDVKWFGVEIQKSHPNVYKVEFGLVDYNNKQFQNTPIGGIILSTSGTIHCSDHNYDDLDSIINLGRKMLEFFVNL